VQALRPAGGALGETVLDALERRAREALAAVPRARSKQEAEARRPALRRSLERSLGYRQFPWPPQPRPQSSGVLEGAGYRIEKLVYETLPGVRVAAHLYLPDKFDGRAPGILFYTGHWWADSKSRPDFQAFSINMARLGFVVLAFDAFGQGERGISNRDHRRTSALLAGISQQGFAEYETQCALAVLLARPEVDPRRIGITGASGGGYNTWITAALDDRIAAAAPVVGTSEFYEQIHVCRPLDWYHAHEHCHFVPGLIRYANNHELLAMAAPKPVLIVAASVDQSFPIAGVREVYRHGASLYHSFGAPEKIALYEDETAGHGYQQKKREAVYGWFLRWLRGTGDGKPFPEPATGTLPWDAAELRCFPEGGNQPAGPGMEAAVRRVADTLVPAGRLPEPPGVEAAPIRPGDAPVGRLLIPSADGVAVPAFVARPAGPQRGVLVGIDDTGKESLASDPLIVAALANGWTVCGIDPRGIGELATGKDGWVAAVSLLLGENFVLRQAADILAAARTFGKPLGLYGRGPNASLAAAYAIGRRPPRWYVLRDGFLSFRHFLDRPKSLPRSFELHREARFRTAAYDREIPFAFFPFDALRQFDIPQLLSTDAAGLVVNPVDGDWERLPRAAAQRVLPGRLHVVSEDRPDGEILRFFDSVR
jgi:dienelactone hydrolase